MAYVYPLHSFTLLYGYLDIGGYGCNENNLIVILLHEMGVLYDLRDYGYIECVVSLHSFEI